MLSPMKNGGFCGIIIGMKCKNGVLKVQLNTMYISLRIIRLKNHMNLVLHLSKEYYVIMKDYIKALNGDFL